MSYKLVKIASYYKDFLTNFYAENTKLPEKSYQNQLSALMKAGNSWADYYSKNLEKLGVEAYEIVANAIPLQKAWANENNSDRNGVQLVLEQIKKLKPDVVWFQDSFTFNGQFIRDLRREVSSVKLVIGNCCSPYTSEHLQLFAEFDFITTCSPLFEQKFNSEGLKALLLYQAFEPKILDKISTPTKEKDIIFIGNIISGEGYHDSRKEFLEKILAQNIVLDFRGNIYNRQSSDVLKKQILFSIVKTSKSLGLKKFFANNSIYKKGEALSSFPKRNKISAKLAQANKPAVHGRRMFEALSSSKIGLNIHGDIAGNFAANMRMFETTGVGTCLLTDDKQNIAELFVPNKEIITFQNADECVEKAKWLLANPKKLEEIALAGQQRTLKTHNYFERAKKLDKSIRQFFR